MKIPPFRLERYFARHEFTAPYLLCTSDCESMRLQDLLDLDPRAGKDFSSLWLGYTEAAGHPDLRQQIVRTLYAENAPDRVLVHSGAEEAIFNFMNVFLAPGDHAVVQAPYYQSLGDVARAAGANVDLWTGNMQAGWTLDLKDLKKMLLPRTKLVVVNFPHNPTGFLPDKNFILELVRMAEKHGFFLFSDEVYRGLELDPADRLPAMADLTDQAVSLGVMSKTYGLAGLRIGWTYSRNKAILDKLAAFKDYTTICNSAPSEFLATLALKHAHSIAGRNLDIIRANLRELDLFFSDHGDVFSWHRPKAGSIGFPQLLTHNVDAFCEDLRVKKEVLLLPGTLYSPAANAFRIGFGRRDFPQVLKKFKEYMEETVDKQKSGRS